MCLAVPGKLIEITRGEGLLRSGRVSFAGVIKDINLAYVPEAKVDDYLLVHVGVALSIVDEQEAAEALGYWQEIAEAAAEAEEPGS
jgi:hydrogenase expression/formation protein HypC